MYRELDPARIVATAEALARRIGERFPNSSLSKIGLELVAFSRESAANLERLRRPHWPIRAAAAAGVVFVLFIAGATVFSMKVEGGGEWVSRLQGIESGINDLIFIGLALFFLFKIEGRIKRRPALRRIHELRSIAHIIDMHQLTKDPEQILTPQMATQSSPERKMTRFELARYLDYCSELLSITSKMAALHVQYLDDPVVLDAVNDVHGLTAGLSAKIWQKIMILDTIGMRAQSAGAAPIVSAPSPADAGRGLPQSP